MSNRSGADANFVRRVRINGVDYGSIALAAEALGMDRQQVSWRLNSLNRKWVDWIFTDNRGLAAPRPPKKRPAQLHVTYQLTHKPTGKFYVGHTGYWQGRKAHHFSSLSLGKHANVYMQQAWDAHPGKEHWDTHLWVWHTREESLDHEQKLIDQHTDDPLLMNRATNSRSPIAGLRGDPNVKSLRPRPRKLKTVKELMEFRAAQGARMREYWANPDNLAKRMGGGNPFAKKVIIDGVVYGSVNDAERAGVASIKTIRRRANSELWPNYSWT